MEIGMPEAARYFVQGTMANTMANTMALRFERSGRADATIGCIAQGETAFRENGAGTSVGGMPSSAALQFFSQFQGSIKKAGADLANVTPATLTYSNGLEKVEPIRPDGKIAGADPVDAMTERLDPKRSV
jgi:hypothetical protein